MAVEVTSDDLHHNRREYTAGQLGRADLPADPLVLFGRWMTAAVDSEAADATAMALATATADGTPSVRIVLLKAYDANGFCWYTDRRSQKGRELEENPVASGLFFWAGLVRQVRITGSVEKLDRETCEAYFASRPVDSRLAAAASVQSAPIADRTSLVKRVETLREAHPQADMAPPEEWGGYRLKPSCYEFWQGREGRLHDRFRYRDESPGWSVERLQP